MKIALKRLDMTAGREMDLSARVKLRCVFGFGRLSKCCGSARLLCGRPSFVTIHMRAAPGADSGLYTIRALTSSRLSKIPQRTRSQ